MTTAGQGSEPTTFTGGVSRAAAVLRLMVVIDTADIVREEIFFNNRSANIYFWALLPAASLAFRVVTARSRQGSLFATRSAASGMHIKSGVTPTFSISLPSGNTTRATVI